MLSYRVALNICAVPLKGVETQADRSGLIGAGYVLQHILYMQRMQSCYVVKLIEEFTKW